jgi:hypothetical protein
MHKQGCEIVGLFGQHSSSSLQKHASTMANLMDEDTSFLEQRVFGFHPIGSVLHQ